MSHRKAMKFLNIAKRFVALCLVALACSQVSVAGVVINDTIKSEILNSDVPLCIYLPDGFHRNPQQTYPVLYLLHGLTDNERAWVDKGQMNRVADELMISGEAKQMVIVMPCAGGADLRQVWNGYFNMEGWHYEDFFFKELMPAVEKEYRAGGSRDQRAVAGLSMGGGGSVNYALRYPDMFCACYAMSAWLGMNQQLGGTPKDPNSKFSLLTKAVAELGAVKLLEAMDKEVLKKLHTVAWFIDCGDDDFLLEQSEELHMKMRHLRIPAQFRVRDGNHNWEYWHNSLRWCLPFVSRNFNN